MKIFYLSSLLICQCGRFMDNSIYHNLVYLVPALKVSGIRSKVRMTILTDSVAAVCLLY
jgi:hypothetical protein